MTLARRNAYRHRVGRNQPGPEALSSRDFSPHAADPRRPNSRGSAALIHRTSLVSVRAVASALAIVCLAFAAIPAADAEIPIRASDTPNDAGGSISVTWTAPEAHPAQWIVTRRDGPDGAFAPIADAMYSGGMAATGGSVALRIQGATSAIDAWQLGFPTTVVSDLTVAHAWGGHTVEENQKWSLEFIAAMAKSRIATTHELMR